MQADVSQRFLCSVYINKQLLWKGLGQNKKQAKFLAATQALKNICPELYEEWRVKVKEGLGA